MVPSLQESWFRVYRSGQEKQPGPNLPSTRAIPSGPGTLRPGRSVALRDGRPCARRAPVGSDGAAVYPGWKLVRREQRWEVGAVSLIEQADRGSEALLRLAIRAKRQQQQISDLLQ